MKLAATATLHTVKSSSASPAVVVDELCAKLVSTDAVIGIVGMGYVGQPLAITAHGRGYKVIGFDTDPGRVNALNAGQSKIRTIPDAKIAAMREDSRFEATVDMRRLAEPDVILICVPTPLNRYREPDLSYVRSTAESVGAAVRAGQLVCLESTTYPGCTNEILRPIIEARGLRVGRDVFLAYSPEREDPGNRKFDTASIPKVVGADDPASRKLAESFYGRLVDRVIPVSGTATAEAVKLSENIFRCVNIALVNELKHIYAEMGIDIWEVIDAAATKPFGYMPFYPGPGLGGHCVPIDPFYLSWKAKEFEVPARFIELAGEINTAEPGRVIGALASALSDRKSMGLKGSRILLLGVAYKKNVDDLRESPSLTIFEKLEELGAIVEYYDPWVPSISDTRDYSHLAGRRSIAWEPAAFSSVYDAALIVTDHDNVDYAALVSAIDLVVDTRNATRHLKNPAIVKA